MQAEIISFIHTADLHLGKTYRGSSGETARYEDFFGVLAGIVADAIRERVTFLLIAGDLFHTGQILPRTFARTIETLQPLKDADIPCIAVEGNHDWIHRRDSISWMEALSHMGYLKLLRPARTENGGYRFDPFDEETGSGGRIEIGGFNIYGLGYIGTQACNHVVRVCEAIVTERNILLFHAGIWSYSPVEIGNIKPEEALPLAATFDYIALGHGHKPYIVNRDDGTPYAFNPGSPECVNFGEEKYDKGYYLVRVDQDSFRHEFRRTSPRPMLVCSISLDGAGNAEEALERFREQVAARCSGISDERQPLLELKLTGRVGFHPFELGRERLRLAVGGICTPLHVEIKNHTSLVAPEAGDAGVKKSLAEIEQDVLRELIASRSEYKGREEELIRMSLAIRDQVLKGDVEGADLIPLLDVGNSC